MPVSPRSFNRLLQQGESILLYPGGIREAFKKKDELYQLFWPEKSEFVRTAAKHNATIVTLASVGLDETWEIILDQEDVLKTPLLKDIAQRQIQLTREALPGISTSIGDVFVPVNESIFNSFEFRFCLATCIAQNPEKALFPIWKAVQNNKRALRRQRCVARIIRRSKLKLKLDRFYLFTDSRTT